MKTALINAPWYSDDQPDRWGVRAGSRWPHFQKRSGGGRLPRYIPFPFFMAIAAAKLESEGHEVMLLDGVAEGAEIEAVYSRVRDFAPDLLFFETSTPSLFYDIDVLRELRSVAGKAFFAAGGTHSGTIVSELFEAGLDYWIAGEYEESLAELVDALDRGDAVAGISGLMESGDAFMGCASVEDVELLPSPLLNQLPVRNYSDPVCGLPGPVAQGWLSRGCPYGCTFCVWPQLMYGNRSYRKRSIDRALDDIEHLISEYGCESFYFDDDTANIGEDRMLELASKIRQRGLDRYPWAMMARADCMSKTMIDELSAAGMYSVKYGVESISCELINACEKGSNLERLKNAVMNTKNAGVKMHLTFTFGVPGETRETMLESVDYAIETAAETTQFSLCTPFPGTAFYDECKQNGWLKTEDWRHYLGTSEAVVSTPSLSAEELMEGYSEACDRWQKFVQDREDGRARVLVSLVKALKEEGAVCLLVGDEEFASEIGLDLQAAENSVNDFSEGAVPVIVSRHDEEKLYRRLLRGNPPAAARAVRLYG